VSEDADKISFR